MLLLSSLLRHVLPKTLGLLLVLGGVLSIGDRVSAMTIEGWKYDPEKGQVEFEIADGVKPRHFLMAQPARIVVDLQDTQMGSAPAQMTYTSGPVQRITVEQLQPQLTRVTLFMFPSTVFAKGQVAIERVGDGNRGTSDVWTLRPLLKGLESKTSVPTPATPPAIAPTVSPVTAPPSPPLLQIKTQSQTLTQPLPPSLTQPQAPVSQSIPIAVPAAKPEPSIVSRLSLIRPATPPQLEDMPPGMAAVIQPNAPVSTAKPVVKASPLPTKLETVKPEPVKPEPVKPEAVKPEVAKPEPVKPAPTLPVAPIEAPKPVLVSQAPKPQPPQPPLAAVPVPGVAVPIAPPAANTLFPPTTEAPVSVSIPIAVPAFTPSPIQTSQIIAKADDIAVPDSLPTLTPTAPTQPSTVSVPPLSTISPVPAPAMTPVPSPTAQPMAFPKTSPSQPSNQSPSNSFPLPDRLPQVLPQVSPQPTQSVVPQINPQVAPQSSFPLPDRMPTVIPTQPAPMPQQPSIFPAAGIAQPVDRNPIASNPATVQPNVINFGQPLVTSVPPSNVMQPSLQASAFGASSAGPIVLQSSSDGRVGLPAGTVLMVRYTGISPIAMKGEARREILTLQSAIRDRNGAVLAPEGTTIYGAFVGKQNRFVAESIVLQGQTIALVAESPNLGGARNPSERSLLQNSGIGLLAGVLIGGLSGGNALGGAAAGAVVSYATAPQSATIQPGQTLELKLTQDWIIPFGTSVSQAVGG